MIEGNLPLDPETRIAEEDAFPERVITQWKESKEQLAKNGFSSVEMLERITEYSSYSIWTALLVFHESQCKYPNLRAHAGRNTICEGFLGFSRIDRQEAFRAALDSLLASEFFHNVTSETNA